MSEAASTPVVSDMEQRLCVQCGLCCDGTLFEWGRILADDDLDRLEVDGFILIATAQGTGFAQPCPHHQNGLCAVYQQGRPQVCRTFRCALLRRVEAGELAWAEAQARIERTVALVERIQAQLPAPGDSERTSLKQRLASWQAAQTAAGVDVQRTFPRLLLDFVSLQHLLDQHFRLKPKQASADEMSAPDNERFIGKQGADDE
ncbi:MAG: YkgJ family cysteine cluster protein [Chloroflexia bacterium]|nr:YkgJ family cysteine cluster protein [Chloroflexia bacterium]